MNKTDDYIKYTCRGYRYAPESFRVYKVYINQSGGQHKYVEMLLTAEQRAAVGNARICKGESAASALARRYDRAMLKKQGAFITYGFVDAGDASKYYYTHQLRCKPDAPLKEKLYIFKEFKKYLARGSEVKRSEGFLDAYYRPVEHKKVNIRYRVNADLTKPVIVYLKITDERNGV